MSYSRWSETCNWYVYAHVDNYISCHCAGGVSVRWHPGTTYEEFKTEVNANEKLTEERRQELFAILDRNLDAIEEMLEIMEEEDDGK